MAGGGGGGGRIAIYGQSITNKATISVAGGKCGVMKKLVELSLIKLDIRIHAETLINLNDDQFYHIGALFLNLTNNAMFIENNGLNRTIVKDTFQIVLQYSVHILPSSINATKFSFALKQLIKSDVSIADVYFLSYRVYNSTSVEYSAVQSYPSSCSNSGNSGTLYTKATMTTLMYISSEAGAEGTGNALFIE